jgi:hypothetical protein
MTLRISLSSNWPRRFVMRGHNAHLVLGLGEELLGLEFGGGGGIEEVLGGRRKARRVEVRCLGLGGGL